MNNTTITRAQAVAPKGAARRFTLCAALACLMAPAALAQIQQAQPRPTETVPAQQAATQPVRAVPPLRASPREIKLGFIDPEAVVSGTTTLTNTSDQPIRIERTASSCSCTVADLSEQVLQPGESIPLEATLTAGKNLGGQQRAVRVFVEGYTMPYEIWVTAEVAYGVRANPIFVNAIGIQRTGEIYLESVDGAAFSVLSTNGQPVNFVGFDPASDKPRNTYTIRYDFTGVAGVDLPLWYVVETDHPRAPTLDLRVVNQELAQKNVPNPRAPWRLMDDRTLLGVIEPGMGSEFTINISANRRIDAMPVLTADSDKVTVDLINMTSSSEGVALRVRVGVRSDARGLLTPAITVDWQEHQAKHYLFLRAVPREDRPS